MQSRRVFLKSGAMALVTVGFAPSFLARTVEAAGTRKKLLIAIFQRGAVDGLNMVVPFGEVDYYRARPGIAIQKPGRDGGALDLDGFFGLHPRMAPLKPFWDEGHLAIVHASGSHDTTRSHFDAQDYMESATPGVKSTRDGWLNRYLQAMDDERNPLRGVAMTRQMPRALQGRAPAVAMASIATFDVLGDTSAKASFEAAYQAAADQVLNGTAAEAFDAMRTLSRHTTAARAQPASGAEYPRSPFGQALQEIASLAKADVGLEVAFAESTNWDHHVNEGAATGQMANRLDDLSRGIAALVRDLGDRMADTVILTMSEFGRAVVENGGRGTDHGHGNAMLLIGGGVRGAHVYGDWPGLRPEQRFEGRDLAVTTDFRDVFAEIVVRHLGATTETAARVFPGYRLQARSFKGLLRT
ncbi:MAG: DUF1501 domain-containing protein [Acidobacteriota bacterium]|nr:DUF1501 domain-containing protein [Acidobacteriota bacterium]